MKRFILCVLALLLGMAVCDRIDACDVFASRSALVLEQAPLIIEQAPLIIEQEPIIIQQRAFVDHCNTGRCGIGRSFGRSRDDVGVRSQFGFRSRVDVDVRGCNRLGRSRVRVRGGCF